SVSLMPGSGFGSVLRSLIAVSCSGWEMAQQRREQSSGHAINQQHGEQQEQIQNRKAEHLLTRGMTACFATNANGKHDHRAARQHGGYFVQHSSIAEQPRRQDSVDANIKTNRHRQQQRGENIDQKPEHDNRKAGKRQAESERLAARKPPGRNW